MDAGSKLGPYEVIGPIGAGGMGEVYQARDVRLDRVVAIKVLPTDRMADADRRRRFLQEARAASALNHPNIITIHEIESADGIDFIVMEYIRGRSLDEIIPREGMRLAEVLRLAIPIADALASAHVRGIVHRDIKPANVMVTDEGTVKVLDFGLAKLVRPSGESLKSETATDIGVRGHLSRPGTVAGTLGYMSPEQAAAGKVDARSDVFSFGAVLYEMATGRRAFAGSSTAEVLAALMKEQPKPASEVVPGLPRELDRMIQRCLQKEPGRRFQNSLDLKIELEQIKDESDSGRAAARPDGRKRLPWLGRGLVIALLLATATWRWRGWSPEVTPEPPRLGPPVTSLRGIEAGASLSPDGEQVAFTWNGEKEDNFDIYVKMIGSSDMLRLTTDPAMDIMPSWSPDGKRIAYVRHGPEILRNTVRLVSPLGGSDRPLGDFPLAFGTPSWSPDSRWLAVAGASKKTGGAMAGFEADGLYLLPVNGDEPRALRIPQEPGDTYGPKFAPDGRHLAYLSGSGASQYIAVVGLGADYMPTGPPRRITQRPIHPDGGMAWTRDGKSILYVEWGIRRLWRVDIWGDHAAQPVEIAGFGSMRPAVAASRDRLVFVKDQDDTDIYRLEVGRPAERVIASTSKEGNPEFSPDGRRVAFESERTGEHQVWLAKADGSSPVQLTHGPGIMQGSPRWSPDGRRIAFDSKSERGEYSVWTIDADGASPRRLTQGSGDEHLPNWSRDGRFIYFTKGSSGVWRVPVTGGNRERMTEDGGHTASESIDGKTLFFMRNKNEGVRLLALSLVGGPERQIAECVGTSIAVGAAGVYALDCWQGAAPLFLRDSETGQGRFLGNLEDASDYGLTVSPDGKTVLYTRRVNSGQDLMMIENFR
jgi:serine/threonine protein kinase/Tol biopolymer transport system component